MAMSPARSDREYQKFKETSAGNTAVRICNRGEDPLEVTFTSASDESVVSTFGTASSVASSATATIVTYTVPVSKKFFLNWIEASGNNIATYTVEIDSTVEGKKRTWFGGNIATEFDYSGDVDKGVELAAGAVIELKVENFRPSVGDFEGRILGVLKDA